MKTYPQKFTGSIIWLYPENSTWERFPVTRALLHSPTELVIDCDCGDPHKPYLYTIALTKKIDNLFEGAFGAGKSAADQSTGKASGRVYYADSGIMVRGNWIEDSKAMDWFAELTAVAHFPNEQRP